MKSAAVFPLLSLAWLGVNPLAVAQIAVGTNGSPLDAFGSIPPAARWSSKPLLGGAANPESDAGMDAFVNGPTNAATTITAQVEIITGDPPTSSANARWTTSGYLITRPIGNAVTLLMATLTNITGAPVYSFRVKYDYTQKTVSVANEAVKGHRVYYNLSGGDGQWMPVGDFGNSFTTNVVQGIDIPIDLSATPWTHGAAMYLLFADDNSSPAADGANAIDNFRVTNVVAVFTPFIAAEPQGGSVAPGQSFTFDVGIYGGLPLFYRWRKNSNDIVGATNATYTINSAETGDQGFYSVIVTNAFGSTTSSVAALTVGCVTPVTLTAQIQDQTLTAGSVMMLSMSATGTAQITYQWYLNTAPISGATNRTYTKVVALEDSGTYYVRVSNCAGSQTSGSAYVGVVAPPYVLMGLTNHLWKYEQSGTDLGTAWRAINYDDSTWPSGRGILAREDNAPGILALTNTVLSLADNNNERIPTYYFRTHFTLTNDLTSTVLISSNYFDDGVIVFLNGVEAFRYDIGPDPIAYNTLAPAANPAGEGVFIVSNFPPHLLIQGDNVLAVELHQNSLTSVDIAFGMQVNVVSLPPTVLQVTNQPADLTILEGFSTTFTTGVAGNGARYQWFKDGSPIPGATVQSLTLNNLAIPDSGYYALQASNVFGLVFSRLARLIVMVDPDGPELLAADWLDATHLNARFSKPLLLLTATNLANYSVSNTLGAALNIVSATLTNGTNVLLTTSAADAGANYILSAEGIADMPPAHNLMLLSSVPVARTVPLIAFDSFWFYYDPYGPPIDNFDPGANWKDANYDTSNWGHDAGSFSYSQNSAFVPPVPVSTTLGPTPAYTAYFRNEFTLALSPGGLTMKLRYAVDDGAIFYLNGVELQRFNMPPGVVTPQTPPLTPTNAALISMINFPLHLLRSGVNLFAAELHQTAPNDTDKFFALELIARAESLPTGPLLVLDGPSDTSVVENQTATFRVSSVAATTFQWRINETDIPGATNSVLTFAAAMSLNGAQFRCLCGNTNTSILTTNATLHVLPDLVRPEFLSAVANGDNTFTLSFSKPLNAATANDVGNYVVTNSAGILVVVNGATLVNGTNVILTFATPLAGRYTVVVHNVSDTSATPNAVASGSAVTVGANYFVPMDSAWKYLLINTNETVQTAFMGTSYDDSTWLGPSDALFYVENAALPGPKNTLLSLYDVNFPTNQNRINTYYFRQPLSLPLGGTNATIRVRHIIDDGMILYLNGKEIYRFNLPPGPVSAVTQGLVGLEGTLLGPFEILNVTNLIAGTNLLAAEVHQQGFQSSDIVMGVELSVHVPGVRLPSAAETSAARLAITSWGNQFALSWGESGFTLEGADNVAGPWAPLATSSPFFVPRTNSTAFFRLHR